MLSSVRRCTETVLPAAEQNGRVSSTEVERVATKLAERYPPPRLPRSALVGLVTVLAAVFLGWTLWTAWLHAEPEVSGQVPSFAFPSDAQASFTLTVQRRDPSTPVTCRVIVQSVNHATVGQKDVAVPARPEHVVDVTDTIRTLQRGTSVSVSECQVTR